MRAILLMLERVMSGPKRVRALFNAASGLRYINCGDWVESNFPRGWKCGSMTRESQRVQPVPVTWG